MELILTPPECSSRVSEALITQEERSSTLRTHANSGDTKPGAVLGATLGAVIGFTLSYALGAIIGAIIGAMIGLVVGEFARVIGTAFYY